MHVGVCDAALSVPSGSGPAPGQPPAAPRESSTSVFATDVESDVIPGAAVAHRGSSPS